MPGPWYFSWCGGALEEQVTLVTSGTTHGARPERASIVGDVGDPSSGQQLRNLASSQGLEAGALYRLEGPAISPGTFFLFDDSILSGLPNSLNLSHAATGTLRSATYVAAKAIMIGTIGATIAQGSDAVSLAGVPLAAGTYGIFGTGIGETDVPVGTQTGTTYTSGGGITTVSSAYLTYDGTSGTGHMQILAATPHTTLGVDMFGQPTNVTTYTVAAQPVRALTSGFFPFAITGFPTEDAYIVDDVPSAALMGLTPGLVYNISGNGIQTGTTFVAPASSATAIELDMFATSSELGAILTINGPRTPDQPFDPALHNRFDEEIISVEIAQEEGGFASLTVDIKNPGIGLLAVGRKLWCWLSWDQAWTPDGSATPDLVPLFNGRLVGVPRLQANEIVQLQFLGRPDDLNVQKEALADELAVLPYYDPIWLAQGPNPDTVLETYSRLFHTDRVSLELTASDILEGEDGIVDIGEDQAIYDRFSLSFGQPPLLATTVTGTVTWQQQADGSIDVTQKLVSAFTDTGSAYPYAFPRGVYNTGGGGLIECLCGDGLKSDWPRPGTGIGGGWTLSTRNDYSGHPLCYIEDALQPTGWIKQIYYVVAYAGQTPPPPQTDKTQDQSNVDIFLHPYGNFTASFPLNVYKIRMNLDYKANRRRTETVTAVLTAGVQMELSDSSESDREAISLSSQYVGEAVDADGSIPIGSLAYRSYFQTARGAASWEYLLLAARAKMRARARSVDVTFAVGWRTALGITLRNSVQLTDRRLPGGVATGKVKSYRLTAGTAGQLGEFTIGCSIGTGDGFDLAYETLEDFSILDDGLNLTALTADTAVNECIVINGLIVQVPALYAFHNSVAPTAGDPLSTMRSLTTTVTLDLKPVAGGEFHTAFFPAVTMLALPRTIDLSAYSDGFVPPPGYPFDPPPPDYVPRPPVPTPPQPGVPVYVAAGYVNAGYEQMRGAQIPIAI